MQPFDTVIATLPETQLTLGGLLKHLHLQGRLAPLVREALTAQLVRQQAEQVGLSVSDAQLQAAADDHRRRHGLESATDTHAWLAKRGLTVKDFEAALEHELYVAQLLQHVTAALVDDHFAAHHTEYERLRLAEVVVGREDLARELATQVRDEGRCLADVASEQGLQLTRTEQFNKDISSGVANAIAGAEIGELVGPIATRQGFLLLVVEHRQAAETNRATRRSIQDELFATWLSHRILAAKIDVSTAWTL